MKTLPITPIGLSPIFNSLTFAVLPFFFAILPIPIEAQDPAHLHPELNENGTLTLRLTSQADSYYILRHTTSPNQDFQPLQMRLGTGNDIDFTPILGDSNVAFFQVQSVSNASPLDLDSDGLDDCYELQRSAFLNPLEPLDPLAPLFEAQIAGLKIHAGHKHSAYINPNGRLWAWGLNEKGRFGPQTQPEKIYPKPIQIDFDHSWTQVAGLKNHILAIRQDGTLWAWGQSSTNSPTDTFQLFSPADRWSFIQGTSDRALAIKTDGSLFEIRPQPAEGTQVGDLQPILKSMRIGLEQSWIMVSTGFQHQSGLKADGTLWTWGDNSHGALGQPLSTTELLEPFQVGSDSDWVFTIAGLHCTFGIKSNGSLWAWGDNQYHQLGIDTSGLVPIPTQIGTDFDWVYVAPGISEESSPPSSLSPTVALKSNGSIWGWGYNTHQSLGFPSSLNLQPTPIQLHTDTNWSSIKTGYLHTLARRTTGELMSWGMEQDGQLGDGLTPFIPTPIPLDLDPGWVSVGHASDRILGIRSDGSLWQWKSGEKQLLDSGDWHSIDSRFDSSLLRKKDGSLWGMGLNFLGQLGLGHTDYVETPQPLLAQMEWSSFHMAFYFGASIDSNGNLWAWGNNGFYQILNPNTLNNPVLPQKISENQWRYVDGDVGSIFGIRTDGSLWAWGDNFFGNLGTGTTNGERNPTNIQPGSKWMTVSSLVFHTVGIQEDGSLWGWGKNDEGMLGDETFINQPEPVRLSDQTTWIAAKALKWSNIGLQSDGTLWSWGVIGNPRVGDGSTLSGVGPQQIGTENSWIHINASFENSTAIKSDGTIWFWGDNQTGILTLDHPIHRVVTFPPPNL